jgi:uncharacterized protein YxjI
VLVVNTDDLEVVPLPMLLEVILNHLGLCRGDVRNAVSISLGAITNIFIFLAVAKLRHINNFNVRQTVNKLSVNTFAASREIDVYITQHPYCIVINYVVDTTKNVRLKRARGLDVFTTSKFELLFNRFLQGGFMSELVVVGFQNETKADEVLTKRRKRMNRITSMLVMACLVALLGACAPSATRVLGDNSRTYTLTANLFSTNEFIIKDAASDLNYYRVEPNVFSLGQSLNINDVRGPNVGRIDRQLIALTPTFDIYREGTKVATLGQSFGDLVANALVGERTGDTFTVSTEDGSPEFVLRGDVFDLNYSVVREGVQVANVTKPASSLFGIGTTGIYFVEVAPGQDDVLILEIVIAFNELVEAQRKG